MKNKPVWKRPELTYVIFNKPYGVLSQYTDDMGRPTLKKFIPFKAIYPVGRLDMDTEGLLLLTNDGDLNHWLASPKNRMYKTYLAQVEGIPSPEQIDMLKKGVMLSGNRTLPAKVKQIEEPRLWERPKPIRFRKTVPTSWIEMSIMEGQNHQVKRMTAAVGLPCLRLIRVALGPLVIGKLAPGQFKLIPKPKV
jgi:23S rRNA pseudouridine2457 synthase